MSTPRTIREALVAAARRYSRAAHEVEDLAHDIIVSALQRGSGLEGESFVRSVHGAARRHAAFVARTAHRRRARETCLIREHTSHDDVDGAPLSRLSPTLRTTLLLLCTGLEKAELRVVLGLSDPALRKRFQALRERAPLARPDLAPAPARPQLRRSQVRLLPRLAAALGVGGRALAIADPDGHGIILAEVLTSGGGAATPGT